MTWFRRLLEYFFPRTMMLPTRMPRCASQQYRVSSDRCPARMDTRCLGGNCTAHCREHCGPNADCFDEMPTPEPARKKQKEMLN